MRKKTAAVLGYLLISVCSIPSRTQAFNSVDSTHNLTYFNYRPMPPNAYRVLFIGDSLNLPRPNPKSMEQRLRNGRLFAQ
jgi:hypothetical protein